MKHKDKQSQYSSKYYVCGKGDHDAYSVHGDATKEIHCKYYIDLGQFIEKMEKEDNNEIKKFVDSIILLLQTFDNYDVKENSDNNNTKKNVNISALERFKNLLE